MALSGDLFTVREGSHRKSSSPRSGRRVLFNVFSCSEEGRWVLPNSRFEASEFVPEGPSLSNAARGRCSPVCDGRRLVCICFVDLKDAYFHVPIAVHHRKFLRFSFLNQAYQFKVLPFGLSLAPRVFTRCVGAALSPLWLRGVRILP